MDRKYYEAMEQQQFEIRRLRHDLSNHLQTLLALPGEQKDDYIRGMLDNPAFGQTLVWCGDSTVNAVLTSKKSLAEQKGIRFTARVDMEALSNDMLVLFGKRYAREMEYSIDELGVLALHTRIEELQTIDHVVTVVDVKRIVDEAIRHASRKTLGHFFDILLAKRYDDEDMVVLTEKDFVA